MDDRIRLPDEARMDKHRHKHRKGCSGKSPARSVVCPIGILVNDTRRMTEGSPSDKYMSEYQDHRVFQNGRYPSQCLFHCSPLSSPLGYPPPSILKLITSWQSLVGSVSLSHSILHWSSRSLQTECFRQSAFCFVFPQSLMKGLSDEAAN